MTQETALHDYFFNTVKPTIAEFLAHKTDLRKARVASIVLYHMYDYAKENSVAITAYSNINGRLALMVEAVRAAANASKHGKLTNPRVPKHIASTSDQVYASNNPGLFQAPFGVAVFAEANYVHLLLDKEIDGMKTISMVEAIGSVQAFWEEIIQNIV